VGTWDPSTDIFTPTADIVPDPTEEEWSTIDPSLIGQYCLLWRSMEDPSEDWYGDVALGKILDFHWDDPQPSDTSKLILGEWEILGTNYDLELGKPPYYIDYQISIMPRKFVSLAQIGMIHKYQLPYALRWKRTETGTVSNLATGYENPESLNTWPIGRGIIDGLPEDAPSGGWPGDKIEIFRLDIDITTAQVYKKVGEVDPGTTSFSEDEPFAEDAEVWLENKNYPAVNEENQRIGMSNRFIQANRLWGSVGNKLYYSEAFDTLASLEYYGLAGLNYFEFQDKIINVIPYETVMYVLLENEVWGVYGTDPNSAVQRRITSEIGGGGSGTSLYKLEGSTWYKGIGYVLGNDNQVYMIQGDQFNRFSELTAAINAVPIMHNEYGDPLTPLEAFVRLLASGNAMWMLFGEYMLKYDFASQGIWKYSFERLMSEVSGEYLVNMFRGAVDTYLTLAGRVYYVDGAESGTESFDCMIESPPLMISDKVDFRGQINRLLVPGKFENAVVEILVDGEVQRTIPLDMPDGGTANLHFTPVWSYYITIRIRQEDVSSTEHFEITGPIVINPW